MASSGINAQINKLIQRNYLAKWTVIGLLIGVIAGMGAVIFLNPLSRYSFMPKETPRKVPPEDYKIYNDPIEVMCFLPPKRCKNCDG